MLPWFVFGGSSFTCTANFPLADISDGENFVVSSDDQVLGLNSPAPKFDLLTNFTVSLAAPAAPHASFTATPIPATPGEFQFTSTSSDPGGQALTGSWNFGDGTSAPGLSEIHTFPHAGTYIVTLTVTNASGRSASANLSVLSKPPPIAVSLVAAVPTGGVAVGQTLAVKVTVTAGTSALNTVKLGVLSVTNKAFTTSTTPSGTSGFALAANASQSFTFQLNAVAAATSLLAISASGLTVAGANVMGTGQQTVVVARKAIAISLSSSPTTLALSVDDKGAVAPKTVIVTATVTNTSKMTVKNFQLISLAPEPQDQTQSLNQLALSKTALPYKISSLAPGAKYKATFALSVTGDGAYQWRALALYDDPTQPGGNGRAIGLGGPFEATVPPFFFRASTEPTNVYKQGSANWVRAGATWYISGEVRNESAYKTLCVSPLLPKLAGNAAGIGPHDITVASVGEDAPPFAGALKPGASASIEMYVDTTAEGSTRGTVMFAPQASVLPVGSQCTATTYDSFADLKSSDITLAKDSTQFTTRVDTSNPVAIATSFGEPTLYFFGGFASGVVEALFSKAVELESTARQAATLDSLYSAIIQSLPPVATARLVNTEYNYLVVATDVIGNYWRTASASEKSSVLTQIASVLQREGNDFWSAVTGTVRDDAKTWLDQVQMVYASGDDRQVFALYGSALGKASAEVALNIALAEVGGRIASEAPKLATSFERFAGESVVIKALQDMPAGKILNFEEMQRLWGLSQDDLAAFAQIAKDEDVLIGVRGRAPISVENLEEGAVWKHENLKPKNVSPIDIDYLGFPSSSSGLVQFRTYTFEEEHAIFQKIQNSGLSAADQKVVLARFETRLGEAKYVRTIEGYSKAGEINIGFNYADNGIDISSTRQIRKFQLASQEVEGGTLYTPYQENLNLYRLRKGGSLPKWCERALSSVLCRVTGDMDGVYITTTEGGAVAQAKLVQIYDKLQAAGWQHPETLTWINGDGQFMFGAKSKILQGLQQGGGEPIIQFAPNGQQYATYIDLAKSKLYSSNNYYLDLVGGYTNLVGANT